MVSVRRRKLLGLCTGKIVTAVELSRANERETISHNPGQDVNSVHPEGSTDSNEHKEVDVAKLFATSGKVSGSSYLKEEPMNQDYQVSGVKRRKRHRRKHVENQEPCTMRGVYFKNMKWQAAIKVDKKQIHLGTVGSQEEAARLYDRAAFMCGREPNFELSEEEKHELRQFNWEEFLELTRQAISSKKHQRRAGSGMQRKGVHMQSDAEEDAD